MLRAPTEPVTIRRFPLGESVSGLEARALALLLRHDEPHDVGAVDRVEIPPGALAELVLGRRSPQEPVRVARPVSGHLDAEIAEAIDHPLNRVALGRSAGHVDARATTFPPSSRLQHRGDNNDRANETQ